MDREWTEGERVTRDDFVGTVLGYSKAFGKVIVQWDVNPYGDPAGPRCYFEDGSTLKVIAAQGGVVTSAIGD